MPFTNPLLRLQHFYRACLTPATLVLTALALAPPAPAQAFIRRQGGHYLLGNRYLVRVIGLHAGRVQTLALRNRMDGRSYAVSGGEFQLRLIRERVGYSYGGQNPWTLDARDFLASAPAIRKSADGTIELRFPLALRPERSYGQPGLAATLVYALAPKQFYTRQWLELKTLGAGKLFLDSDAPFAGRIGGARFRLGGFGQPLFGRDLFLGLEYPSSINRARGSRVRLGRIVGRNLGAGGYRTQAAVLGVTPEGAVHRWFMRYVAAMRVAPVRPYLLYNTWFDLPERLMNEAALSRRARQFHRILTQRYHLRLNAFVLDDAWDNYSTLWRVDRGRFPGGFAPLVKALDGVPTRLGLWFGPIGGYSNRRLRLEAARRLGMEITTNGQFLCLAGRNYSRYFTHTLLDYQRRFHVTYFKLDGIPFGCNDPNHGHPVGIYSREADLRVFRRLLMRLRAQDPRVFINATTSIWLSPWWLKYADTVWMGGSDSGYLPGVPTLQPRESAISYRDSVLYLDFVRHHLQFPMNSLMTHGIIRGRHNLLGGRAEPLGEWENEIVHYFSVGNMMYELYITPALLDRREWDALAAGIGWAEANAHPLLDNSTMVLGDPAKRQAYGFVHASPARTLVMLRNPFVRPQDVSLPLSAANGFLATRARLTAETIYPYRRLLSDPLRFGGRLRLRLGPYEERVIELKPYRAHALLIAGARDEIAAGGAGSVEATLYAPAGAERAVRLTGVEGATVRQLHFGAPGAAETEPSFRAVQMTAIPASAGGAAAGGRVQLRIRLNLPADFTQARLAVLVQPPATRPGLTANAWDNQRPAKLQAVNGGRGRWYWFSLALAPGRHALRLELAMPAGFAPGSRISAWLLANRRLAQVRLHLRLQPGVRFTPRPQPPTRPELEALSWRLLDGMLPGNEP